MENTSKKRGSKLIRYIFWISVVAIILFLLNASNGMFTRYSYFTAKYDISQGNVRFLFCGEPDPKDSIAVAIAPQYGFNFVRVAGCNVGVAEKNGVEKYNAVLMRHLDRTSGSDWFFDWKDETDSLFEVITKK